MGRDLWPVRFEVEALGVRMGDLRPVHFEVEALAAGRSGPPSRQVTRVA